MNWDRETAKMTTVICFPCRSCTAPLEVARERAGRGFACRECGTSNTVPMPREAPAHSPESRGEPTPRGGVTHKFGCGACGQRQFVPPEWAGLTVLCLNCNKRIRVPGAAPAADPGRQQTPVPDRAAAAAARAEGPVTAVAAKESSTRTSPSVRPASRPLEPSRAGGSPVSKPATVSPTAEKTTPGGLYDLEDEPVMPLAQPSRLTPPADAPNDDDAPSRPKKKKKKRKKTSAGMDSKETATVAVVIALATAVATVVGIAIPGIRPVAAMLLLLIGGLLFIIGKIGFSNAARDEGFIHVVLCRYMPGYTLYFLLRRWSTMREYVALYAVGLFMLGPGLYLWKISEDPLDKADGKAVAKAGAGKAAAPAVNLRDEDEDLDDEAPVANAVVPQPGMPNAQPAVGGAQAVRVPPPAAKPNPAGLVGED